MSDIELLAMIFYLARGVINGITRLHKIVFLVEQEFGLGGYTFKPSKFGPWSPDLDEAIKELVRQGLLTLEEKPPAGLREGGLKVLRASRDLLERGREAYERLKRKNPILALELAQKVRVYAVTPLTYLLAYVYREYPEYTIKSIILEKVREWQQFYGLRLEGGDR